MIVSAGVGEHTIPLRMINPREIVFIELKGKGKKEKGMKINFILPFKRMSGGIRVIYIYADYLVKQGHDVVCYLPAISYKGKNQKLFFRFKASISNTLKKEKWYDCTFPVKVVPVIKNTFIRDADVTIASSWQTAYDVKNLSSQKGIKYYFVQGYEVFNGKATDVENTYRLGLNMITINNSLAERLTKISGNENIPVVFNGLFDSEYIKLEKRKDRVFTVMYLYHESPHKKSEDALEVVTELRKLYKNDIRVIVFGRRLPENLPDFFEKYEDPSREQLMNVYRESDVYLFTSVLEAWGLPIVEAMANKCAVVGRKIGALEELYNGRNAIIIENKDEMVREVINLIGNSDRLETIQNNGYRTALDLKWDNSCETFENIITNE